MHYADDDAARYFEILQTLAPGRVSLLSDFDRDTERLFPTAGTLAVPPTRAALERVGRQLAREVQAANALGHETEVYFVFAGHGDMAQGQGFIELSDARFYSRDLERWLRSVPFTRGHVVLDSCNSFFMLGVRKPGGRHFATPEDAAWVMAERLPNVGVFLSTSAEGEAFEWSEIQSGIFSHVVRSGLLGGADANGDGSVSYLELSAFVDTATSEVPNPNMRPHVFARGPGAVDDTPIVQLQSMDLVRRFELGDAKQLRIRLRDKNGLPLLDAHAEGGLGLFVPDAWAQGATVERSLAPGNSTASRVPLQLFGVPIGEEVVTLAQLERLNPVSSPRGPGDTFEQLFLKPFGPRALARYVSEKKARPRPVYGVSKADARRMQLVLDQMAQAERGKRLADGVGSTGMGALLATAGTQVLLDDSGSERTRWILGGALVVGGASALLGGGLTLGMPSIGEQASEEFRAALAAGKDPVQAFAAADERWQEIVASYEKERQELTFAGGLFLAASTGGLIWNELGTEDVDSRGNRRLFAIGGLMIGGLMLTEALAGQTPSETLADIWRDDPSINQYRPGVVLDDHSASVAVDGTW